MPATNETSENSGDCVIDRIYKFLVPVLFSFCATSTLAATKFDQYICDLRDPSVRVILREKSDFSTLVLGSEVFVLKQMNRGEPNQRFSVTLGKNLWQVFNAGGFVSVQKNGIPRLNCSNRLGPKGTRSDYEKSTGYLASGASVYDGPSFNNAVIANISGATPIYLQERSGGKKGNLEWFEIEYGDKKSGYIWGKHICSNAIAIAGIRGVCKK